MRANHQGKVQMSVQESRDFYREIRANKAAEMAGQSIGREGLDNDAAIEHDEVLMTMQGRIDMQVRGYHDFHEGEPAALPNDPFYMIGYRGAQDGLTLS